MRNFTRLVFLGSSTLLLAHCGGQSTSSASNQSLVAQSCVAGMQAQAQGGSAPTSTQFADLKSCLSGTVQTKAGLLPDGGRIPLPPAIQACLATFEGTLQPGQPPTDAAVDALVACIRAAIEAELADAGVVLPPIPDGGFRWPSWDGGVQWPPLTDGGFPWCPDGGFPILGPSGTIACKAL